MSLAANMSEAAAAKAAVRRARRPWPGALVSWLQAAPLALVLLFMFVAPLAFVVVVSFFDYDRLAIYPTFMLDNYKEIFTSQITIRLYTKTFEYAAIVEAITVFVGFTVAYFLTFHVRTFGFRIGLLVACTIPFFTSNMIRMISWIPFLGREGILNDAVLGMGLTHRPLDFLLFSDFAVIVGYVHLLTMMMVAPIVNSMSKIDRALISAARDAGASEWQIIWDIVVPLSKTGIALGSALVLTQTMGDYFIVHVLSGGKSAGVVSAISTQLSRLRISARRRQRRGAAGGGDRARRRDLPRGRRAQGAGRMMTEAGQPRPKSFYVLAAFFAAFLAFMYGPMLVIFILSFQGPTGGMSFPMVGWSFLWFQQLLSATGRVGDIPSAILRSLEMAVLASALTVVICVSAGLAFRRRFPGAGALFYTAVASLVMPSLFVGFGIALGFKELGWATGLFTSGLGAQLTWTLPFGLMITFATIGRFDRRFEEAATDLGATSVATLSGHHPANHHARRGRRRAVRVHAVL